MNENKHYATDKQTLADLNLLGKYKTGSLFNLFNRARTRGGELLLEDLFRQPLSEAGAINARSATLAGFAATPLELELDGADAELASAYLNESRPASMLGSYLSCYRERMMEIIYRSDAHAHQQRQIRAVQDVMLAASKLLGQLRKQVNKEGDPMAEMKAELEDTLGRPGLKNLKAKYPYTLQQTVHCQYLFRNTHRERLQRLLRTLYAFDAYISVGAVARDHGLRFGTALGEDDTKAIPGCHAEETTAKQASGSRWGNVRADATSHLYANGNQGKVTLLQATNLRHPTLSGAVGNDVSLANDANLVFLTGANMAGKSTWMKTLGVSHYLAHMGFPLAADTFAFTPMEGIHTSINVPDDIGQGWSHFYAEVKRVKDVAGQVSSGRRVFVLFDELFKGTNVKDAYDATLAVTERLAGYGDCAFVISTHIIEVGEALKGRAGVRFRYMPTVMEGTVPRYTYRLAEGITEDRQGMVIIENEGIVELINGENVT